MSNKFVYIFILFFNDFLNNTVFTFFLFNTVIFYLLNPDNKRIRNSCCIKKIWSHFHCRPLYKYRYKINEFVNHLYRLLLKSELSFLPVRLLFRPIRSSLLTTFLSLLSTLRSEYSIDQQTIVGCPTQVSSMSPSPVRHSSNTGTVVHIPVQYCSGSTIRGFRRNSAHNCGLEVKLLFSK